MQGLGATAGIVRPRAPCGYPLPTHKSPRTEAQRLSRSLATRTGTLRLTSHPVAVEAALVAGPVPELRPCLLELLLCAALSCEAAPREPLTSRALNRNSDTFVFWNRRNGHPLLQRSCPDLQHPVRLRLPRLHPPPPKQRGLPRSRDARLEWPAYLLPTAKEQQKLPI
jgi:hypothetical protein